MKPGTVWIVVVVGLLAMSVAIHGVLLVVASLDPGFALEPDYERKAAQWDEVRREQASSDRLGWQTELRTQPAAPGHVDLTLRIVGDDDVPVDGATVTLEAFHLARARHVVRGALDDAGAGAYSATLPLRPSGIWEFRLTATRGDDRYIRKIRADVLSIPAGIPGES